MSEEMQPVAWLYEKPLVDGFSERTLSFGHEPEFEGEIIPLYTAPPKRKPLSHDEITAIALVAHRTISPYWVFCRAVEKAHGIGVGND